jgi:hypothetical protein
VKGKEHNGNRNEGAGKEVLYYLKLWQARNTINEVAGKEVRYYLKLWQARNTMTMEMRMLANDISFFSLRLLAKLQSKSQTD